MSQLTTTWKKCSICTFVLILVWSHDILFVDISQNITIDLFSLISIYIECICQYCYCLCDFCLCVFFVMILCWHLFVPFLLFVWGSCVLVWYVVMFLCFSLDCVNIVCIMCFLHVFCGVCLPLVFLCDMWWGFFVSVLIV